MRPDGEATADLGLHHEVLLLAVRDAEGTVDPRAVHWAEALAAATLAELVLRGCLALDARGGGVLTALPGDVPTDPILARVLRRVRRFGKAATLAYWTDRLGRETRLRVETAESLARLGILRVRRRGGIPFLSTKEFPANDPGPESALRTDLRRAPRCRAPSARDSARLALVVVGDLLDDVLADGGGPEAVRGVRRVIRSHPIGRAIVDAVAAVLRARASSANARTRAIAANRRMALLFGALGGQGAGFGRYVEAMKTEDR
jgi:hypothetical protein